MITSTYSSGKRAIKALALLLPGALLVACGVASDQPSFAAPAGQTNARKSLHSALQANFDLATQGMNPGPSSIPSMPRDNSAGLLCSPATLDRRSTFRLVLPAHPMDRKGVLAALTPDGSLRIIYQSYGIDTDSEDLLIPSKAIDWESVRSRNEFAIDVSAFDALREDNYAREALFQRAGIYQFALLNGDRELLNANGAPF